MNRETMNKIFSTSLSLALAVSSMPMPARAIGADMAAPAFVAKLTPPEQFGYVASSFAPKSEEKPRLIIISDLHAHVEVQHNIMGMLEDIVPKVKGSSDKKVPVFLEGGWEANLEEPLKGISDPQTRHFMDEYFVQKSELGGPQAYSEKVAGSNLVTMIGVEDKEEYLANKARYAKTYPVRRQLLEAIKTQETAMRLLSDEVEGRSYLKLQQYRDDYNAGRLSPARYAKSLLRYTDRFHIQNRYVTVLQNVASAGQSDLDAAFANVYREVSARLSESRPMTSFLRQQIGNEDNIRGNMARVDADLDLLKRLVSNQLTPSEVTLAMSRMGALIHVAELLLDRQPLVIDVPTVIRQSLDFYPLAFLRDETLVKNSLASLDKMSADATGILVAGGFHTDAIASYLTAHHIAYMVLNPVITRDLTTEEQLNYVKRMCGDHVTAQEVAADVDWLTSGRHATQQALSAGTVVTGTKDNIVQQGPGDTTPKNDAFTNGIRSDVREAIRNGGDQFAAELRAAGLDLTDGESTVASPDASQLSKDIQQRLSHVQQLVDATVGQNGMEAFQINSALPGVTVVYHPEANRYIELGRDVDSGKQTFAEEIANARLAALPQGTTPKKFMYIQSVGTKTALVQMGSITRSFSSEKGDFAAIVLADSYFSELKAMDEAPAPAPGSEQEKRQMQAIHAVAHEVTEINLPNASEEATLAHGWAGGALVAESRFGEGGAQRFAMAVPAQLVLGNVKADTSVATTTKLATAVATLLAGSKNLKVKTVADLADEFSSRQIVTASPEELKMELGKLRGSMELTLALAGYTAPLEKKLRLQIAAKYAEAMAA